MANNFIMGGKLGDFLHSMFAVKQICEQKGEKANVYMCDFGWEFGVETTHAELKPIMVEQDYIESFEILRECEIDPIQRPEQSTPIRVKNEKILSEGYVDLTGYIRSSWLYKTCWSELYSKTFGFEIKGEYPWIKWHKKNEELKGKVLIHRRYNPVRMNPIFPYDQILETYSDNLVFVSSSEKDYEEFPYKQVPFFKVTTLEDWFTSINSCDIFVSNLSGPAVMAHALDKLRIIELPNIIDSIHCMGEEKYSKNVFWYIDERHNNL